MTIETKFSEGDEVFFLHEKKVCNSIVRGMKIERSKGETHILYLCNKEEDSTLNLKVSEQDSFPSKESLLQSL